MTDYREADTEARRAEERRTGQALPAILLDGRRIAWSRRETEPCEKLTPGCCIRHEPGAETECETW